MAHAGKANHPGRRFERRPRRWVLAFVVVAVAGASMLARRSTEPPVAAGGPSPTPTPAEAPPHAPEPRPVAPAPPPRPLTPEQIAGRALAEKVRAFYAPVKDYTARFEQTVRITLRKSSYVARGTVQVKRPARMRWRSEKPLPREFVFDGNTLWDLDHEDRTVMVHRDLPPETGIAPLVFVASGEPLFEGFELRRVDRPKIGPAVLELVPTTQRTAFQHQFLAVDERTGEVTRTMRPSPDGNETQLDFTDVKLNQGLGDEHFTFTPPPGVTVRERPKQP